ncbi:MAG: GxxExxY protein [Chlorobium sp.]|nr:GxxExxY protein [Chlorobium sp.]MCW8815411.1 GxxExxY protein [Chlorobium sp.]MCW8819918.1 GxxExxY protein [Ignavibacteriaceae bacterium]
MPFIYKDETYRIIGAAQEVHKELGSGFLEPVYQEALRLELEDRDIPFKQKQELQIRYKERFLEKRYIADFVCFGKIIVELKAVDKLIAVHEAQLLNYLNATSHRIGLLLNFGQASLAIKRLIS